jgi:hypothetical protein
MGIFHGIVLGSTGIFLGQARFEEIQWIGLRENLQESPIFNGKIYGFRLKFSLKPIH